MRLEFLLVVVLTCLLSQGSPVLGKFKVYISIYVYVFISEEQ